MSTEAKQEARKAGRPPLAMPEPINVTAENVAKAIPSGPPRKRIEWRSMQQKESGHNNWPLQPDAGREGSA